MNLFLAFLLFSITILIVASTVYLNFTYTDRLYVKIDFLLFTLLLYKKREEEKEKKKSERNKFRQGIKKTSAAKHALRYLLRNSALTVHSINLPKKDRDPATVAPLQANISSLILILFTYLSFKTQKISLLDNYFITPYEDALKEPILDFTLKTSLLVFLWATAIYNFKIRRNEGWIKNSVRNKNG